MLPTNDRENENGRLRRRIDRGSEETPAINSLSSLPLWKALDLAFSYYDSGRLLEAENLCRQILQKVPNQVDAMQLLGVLLGRKGQCVEAVQLLREAIKQAPGHAHLHNSLGMTLYQLGKTIEAVSEFNAAIEIRPDFAKAYSNLGVVLMKLGRLDEAVTACGEAVRLQSDFKEAYNNLGLALKKAGQLENAVESLEKALSLDPKYPEALCNLGMVLIAQNKLEQADKYLRQAINIAPNSAEFLNNLGVLFNRKGHFEEAVSVSREATVLRPDYVEAYNNLGTALMELGRFSEAIAAFESAIAIDFECAEAHHNRSLVLLLTGRFEEGWDEYEWRWQHDGFSTPHRPFSQKRWDGSAEGVGKILVWAEQGIGDEVQFAGLIRYIISHNVDVVVECDQRLVPLLQRSFPRITVVERLNPPSLLLEDPSITHQVPMASVPRVLGLSPDSMAFQNSFLVSDEKLRCRLRREYQEDEELLLVGISFRSGNNQEGAKRSIDLRHWGPVFKVEGVRFVNLQYGDCTVDLESVYDRFGVRILEDRKVNPLKDLEGFAAQVSAMDLVISVDNSTVHFAGALGVEVWAMLPNVPDWRWGLGGDSSRWYSTMRLFRQEERGNWEPVISRVAEELTSLIKSSDSRSFIH